MLSTSATRTSSAATSPATTPTRTPTTHPGGIGRLLYYPPSAPKDGDAAEGEGRLGLGAHTDYECFTLLLADSNPGLEILFPPSALTDNKPLWQPCPVRPGTLTVNV